MPRVNQVDAARALAGMAFGTGVRGDVPPADDLRCWEAIVAAARRHGLAPLLYWRLTDARASPHPDVPPPEARAALRSAYLCCLTANLRARQQLAAVVGALAGRGVSPVLLKGAHLAFGVYPDPGVRPMCDLDLLVERDAVLAAVQVLDGLGYAPIRPYDLHAEMALLHHLPPYAKPGCHHVEIHWALVRAEEPYHIDTAALLARSRPAAIAGLSARVLDPADLLLHLCVHAAAADRLAGGLRPLADVVEVLRAMRDDPSLAEARSRATAWGAGRCLNLVLSLCAELIPGALPPGLPAALDPEPIAEEPLTLGRTLVLAPPGEVRQISPNLARALKTASGAALREIGRGFFPSRTFLATIYGVSPRSARIWPCYPRRWIDLVRRYAVPALQAIGGERSAADQAARQTAENALAAWLAGGR